MDITIPHIYYKLIATLGSLILSFISIFVSYAYTNPSRGECFQEDNIQSIEQAIQIICLGIFIPSFLFVKATKKEKKETKSTIPTLTVSETWGIFFNRWIFYNIFVMIANLLIFSMRENSDLFTDNFGRQNNSLVLVTLLSYMVSSQIFNNFFDNICTMVKSVAPEAILIQNANSKRQTISQIVCSAFVFLIVYARYRDYLYDDGYAIIFAVMAFRILSELLFIRYYVKLVILFQINHYAFIKALISSKTDTTDVENMKLNLNYVADETKTDKKLDISFSSIYFELSRVGDLIKMVATTIYISITISIIVILLIFVPSEFGNFYIYFFLKVTFYILPVIYLYTYRKQRKYGTKLNAVAIARNVSIKFLYATSILTMCFVGTHRGCRKLVAIGTEGQKKDMASIFAFYFVKSMALNTTLAFAMACLTSPGIGSWITASPIFKYLLLPSIWPTPHIMQSLHQAFGLTFLFCGGMHGFIWVIVFSLRIVEYGDNGTVFASMSGALMLILGTKLMWPPGVPIPSAFGLPDWAIVRRLEVFLKDSKYGNYHVYFAFFVMVLYGMHGSFRIQFFAAPYFLFSGVAYCILRLVHPSTFQWIKTITFRPNSEQYEIISISAKPLRTNGVQDVSLRVKPPKDTPLAIFGSTFSDVIMLRNMKSTLTWMLESVHYFSVVGVSVIYPDSGNSNPNTTESCIEVKLLISPTRREDGITKLMCKQGAAANSGKGPYSISMTRLIKSSCQAAIYSPNIIAFGFESGAAAFCSILLERSKMRKYIDNLADISQNNLIDLCVVWLSFKPPSRKQVTSSEIATAIKEMSNLQEYLYQNSGSAGVKMIFVATGVPQEWTPSPESIANKTLALEEAVATELNIQQDLVKQKGWDQSESEEEEQDIINSLNHTLRPSELFVAGEFTSTIPQEARTMFGKSFQAHNPMLQTDIIRQTEIDDKSLSSKASSHRYSNFHDCRGTLAGISHHFAKEKEVKQNEEAKQKQKQNEEAKQNQKQNEEGKLKQKEAERLKTLVQVQAHEESWIPLRHALSTSWKEFLATLENRVSKSIRWLSDPQGPDYSTLFITEHRSDVNTLKEFKYADIYNEVNKAIIQQQLKYCKNPTNYLANHFGPDGDPVDSMQTACSVLYSGDFSSAKKDQLAEVVDAVSLGQKMVVTPAYITLIPDG